jgi:endonuclease YncB( thermonuclease family)
VLVLAILAAAPLWAAGRIPDPCGDPAKVGTVYLSYQGTVLQALDPVTLLVAVDQGRPGLKPFPGCPAKGCNAKVRLVNLDPPTDPGLATKAQRALFKAARPRQVTLALSPVQDTSGITNALVYVGTRSINQQQLTAGYATYRRFGPTAVDGYVECKLQRGQGQAKAARRGVWKPSS